MSRLNYGVDQICIISKDRLVTMVHEYLTCQLEFCRIKDRWNNTELDNSRKKTAINRGSIMSVHVCIDFIKRVEE